MDGVEDFDFSCNGLLGVRLAVVGGLVLIDLSGEAPDPDEHVGDLLDAPRPLPARRARAAPASATTRSTANWKGIAENYNECLHCPGVHPELNALSDYMSGEDVDGEGAWCGGSMTLREDAATMALEDGGHTAEPAADRGALATRTRRRSSTSPCSRTRSSRCIPTT